MERKEEKCSLNCPLILRNGEEEEEETYSEIIIEEVKKQLWLSGPLITVNLLQFCIQFISVMFVGHLGELSLSAASMATSFATVTGFSLLMGMGSALDTLCGQSYGGKQYHMLGIHMQRGMLVLLLVSVPLAFVLANTGRILIAVGQDPEISAEAGVYARYMIPCLFAYGLLQCHISLETWSFELVILLSGLLPNPKLETSVLSICLNTGALASMIPSGLGGAVSTRVSNELGAGHPQAARLAVQVVFVLTATEGIVIGAIMILVRDIWGSAYSNEKEVVNYVALMMPILAVSNFLYGLQFALSGTARGCGWQKIGAYVNLGSYYIVGIPCAVLLAFVLHVGGKGLWLGMVCALFVQVFSLLIITIRTNWEQQAKRASERVYDAAILVTMVS
ncbi:hypothetical protein MKX01_037708 [Papaver californicum]|nr:hypothetical protein MKX01_037708 [Papaver californicum]